MGLLSAAQFIKSSEWCIHQKLQAFPSRQSRILRLLPGTGDERLQHRTGDEHYVIPYLEYIAERYAQLASRYTARLRQAYLS